MNFAQVLRAAFLLAAAICASAAYSDGVCVEGYRDTTAAERQTMLGVMEAAKAALPVAPSGWVIGGYEELSAVGSICKDGENTPWSYGFSRTFNRTDDQAAREQALADAGAKIRAAQAARQPRLDALMARSQDAGRGTRDGGTERRPGARRCHQPRDGEDIQAVRGDSG
jgi:hypothetical protein